MLWNLVSICATCSVQVCSSQKKFNKKLMPGCLIIFKIFIFKINGTSKRSPLCGLNVQDNSQFQYKMINMASWSHAYAYIWLHNIHSVNAWYYLTHAHSWEHFDCIESKNIVYMSIWRKLFHTTKYWRAPDRVEACSVIEFSSNLCIPRNKHESATNRAPQSTGGITEIGTCVPKFVYYSNWLKCSSEGVSKRRAIIEVICQHIPMQHMYVMGHYTTVNQCWRPA